MVFLKTPLVTDTRGGGPHVIRQQNIEGLVQNTTGSAMNVVIGGVLTETSERSPKSKIPVIHSKTQPKREGMVPYAGQKY